MKTVHFYFDFMSPYAYLAGTQIPRLIESHRGGALVEGHPFDMWAARLAAGNNGPSNREIPARMKVLMADVARWAKRYGVPIAPPKGFNTERLNRGFLVAKEIGDPVKYLTGVYARLWGAGGDPQNQALLIAAAEDAGVDGATMLDMVDSDEIKARYAAENAHAQEIGVFGAPMFVVDDQMYWGNDRIEWVEEYLREQTPSIRAAG